MSEVPLYGAAEEEDTPLEAALRRRCSRDTYPESYITKYLDETN